MRLEEPDKPQASLLTGYGEGGFSISGERYEGSVLVFENEVVAWPVSQVSEITPASLEPVMDRAADLEILIVGCGEQMALLPQDARDALKEAGVAIDFMATDAACRTHNILRMDERLVAAALIAV